MPTGLCENLVGGSLTSKEMAQANETSKHDNDGHKHAEGETH